MGSHAIASVGNVDGRDVSADGAALDAHIGSGGAAHAAVSNAAAGFCPSVGAQHTVLTSTGTAGSWATITNNNISASAGIVVTKLNAGGTANRVALTTDGTTVSWGQVVNAQVSATAAIAVTKLETGSSNYVLVNLSGTNQWAAFTDALHGNLSGGSLHALATVSLAGFMSAAHWSKLEGIEAGAQVNDVTSVFGRTGAVVATASDYDASQVDNDSGVSGTFVKDALDTLDGAKADQTIVLTAGAGMSGGGDLSASRTFNVVANADGSITVNADDIMVGVLATDAQHGARGGGTQHAVATTSVAGFESAADKTKLNGIEAGAEVNALPTVNNKNMAALVTTGDGNKATNTTLAYTPEDGSYVAVLVNGILATLGNGAKTCACYFSGDGGSTARAFASIAAGDTLHWVGSVAGYQLDTGDRIDFVYNV
jgi:hypothetical protein